MTRHGMCRVCASGGGGGGGGSSGGMAACAQPLTGAVCPLSRPADRPCRLPPIEEAWNKNTSSEMSRETQKLQPAAQAAKLAQQQQQVGLNTPPPGPPARDGRPWENRSIHAGAMSWFVPEIRSNCDVRHFWINFIVIEIGSITYSFSLHQIGNHVRSITLRCILRSFRGRCLPLLF